MIAATAIAGTGVTGIFHPLQEDLSVLNSFQMSDGLHVWGKGGRVLEKLISIKICINDGHSSACNSCYIAGGWGSVKSLYDLYSYILANRDK
jgi:hypothetical protein